LKKVQNLTEELEKKKGKTRYIIFRPKIFVRQKKEFFDPKFYFDKNRCQGGIYDLKVECDALKVKREEKCEILQKFQFEIEILKQKNDELTRRLPWPAPPTIFAPYVEP